MAITTRSELIEELNRILGSALNKAKCAIDNKEELNNVLVYGNYNHAIGEYYGALSVLEKISLDNFIKRYEYDEPIIDDMLKKADILYRKLTNK